MVDQQAQRFSVEALYYEGDQSSLEPVLDRLAEHHDLVLKPYPPMGGQGAWFSAASFIVLAAVGGVIEAAASEYATGLLGLDRLRALGSSHADTLTAWISRIRQAVCSIARTLRRHMEEQGWPPPRERPLAVRVGVEFGGLLLFAAMNHADRAHSDPDAVAEATARAVEYLSTHPVPPDVHVAQLYFDHDTGRWTYLLLYSWEAPARLHGVVDLDSTEVIRVASEAEFCSRFPVSPRDAFILGVHMDHDTEDELA